jgi:O-antigen/teichoic acid export membrane protein
MKNWFIKILKKLEKFTHTDMIYLVKGGFWLGIGQFVASGSAFLSSVAFANLLSPDTYGIYKFVLSINALIIITTLSGMDAAVTQAISRGFDGTLEYGVKEKMKWGTLGSLGSLIIALYYYSQGNIALTLSFAIVALFVPFTESLDIYNSLLWGKKLFSIQSKYNVINILITLGVTVTTLLLTKNIYIILFSYLLSLTIPNIFFLHFTKKFKNNNEVDPHAISYGKHLSLVNIIALVVSQLDKILVFHYIGAANLALYSLAVAPTDQIKGLMKNLNSLAMPKFSESNTESIKKTIWRKVGVLAFVMILIVLCYIFLLPFLFKIFFPKYILAIPYSQILSISLIPVVIAGFLYTILESQKATKEIYQYNLYSNIFSIIILFPMISNYGIGGAIFARLINRTMGLIISATLVNKLK